MVKKLQKRYGKYLHDKRVLIGAGVVLVLLVVLGVFAFNKTASNQRVADDSDTGIFFSPPTNTTFSPNSSADVTVNLDTRGRNVTGIKLVVQYDPNTMTLNTVDKTGSAFGENNMEVNPNFEGNKVIVVADLPESSPVTGDGKKIVTLKFTTKDNGSANLSVNDGTIVETVVNGVSTPLSYQADSVEYPVGNQPTTAATLTATPPVTLIPSPPSGVQGIPDLMILPNLSPARTETTQELDVVYEPNQNISGNPKLNAVSFVLTYPKDLVNTVSFTPALQRTAITKNEVNTDNGTITFETNARDAHTNYFSPAQQVNQPGYYIGRISYKTSSQKGTALFTFTQATMGFEGGRTFSTSNNGIAIHGANVVIRDSGDFLNPPATDPLPPQPEEGSTGTRVLYTAFKDTNNTIAGGRIVQYENFVDSNNNGIFDEGEDYAGLDINRPYLSKDPLIGGVNFKVTGPLASSARFTKDISINDAGYAISDDTISAGVTSGPQVSYALSNFVVPEGYYVFSVTGPYASPRNFKYTPTTPISVQTTKGGLTEIMIGVKQYKKVSGIVYVDENGNGKFDTGEQKKSDVSLTVGLSDLDSGSPTNQTTTTDSDGKYSFQASGHLALSSVTALAPAGFRVSTQNPVSIPNDARSSYTINFGLTANATATSTVTPTNRPSSTVTVTSTSAPSATSTTGPTATATVPPSVPPNGALVKVTVRLPGIGTSFTSDNKNPVQTVRPADIQLVSQGSAPINATGNLAWNTTTKNDYTGTISVQNLTPGYYQIKVRLDNTIYKLIPGVYNLNVGETVNTQAVSLNSGDFNRDNSLDLFDYNIILSCMQGTPLCTQTYRTLADLNSDGKTDPADFNVFLKQLDVRAGD